MAGEKVKTVRALKLKEILGVTAKDKELTAEYLKLSEKVDGQPLVAIAGEVSAHGSKTTTLGPSTFLLGMFRCKNLLTGEVFRSTKFWPPKDMAENVIAAFDSQPIENRAPVQFAYTIAIAEHPKSGHTVISEPIQTVESVNRENELMQKLLMIAGPKKSK